MEGRDVVRFAGKRGKALFSLACLCALGLAALLGSGAASAGADAACPNEAIRSAQHATDLGDCRAWEMVSPVDKNGNEVMADGVTSFSSTSGDAFTYAAHAVFGDAVGSGSVGIANYLARRTAAGWLNHGITPESRPEAVQILFSGTRTEVFSDDLSRALTFGYDLPGATDDTLERINLYLEDTASRGLRTISASQRGNGEDPVQYPPFELIGGKELWGTSSDLHHVAWVSPIQLLPTGTAPGYPPSEEPNVYTWDDGTLHLAGILPDGTVPPGGSRVQPEGSEEFYRGTMSADGSRQTFAASPTAGAPRQLYLRIDNERTVWVSEPEGPGLSEPEGARLEGMTPDGRNVFFTSDTPLLAEDTAGGPDLYRWTDGPDPAHEPNLTLITNTGDALNVPGLWGGSLVGMSTDGNRVYVHGASGSLTVWDEGTTKLVGSLPRLAVPKASLAVTASRPGFGRVSPDGNWVAYVKLEKGEISGGSGGLYLYNLEDEELVCITCAAAAMATISPQLSEGNHSDNLAGRPRFLSDDGRVFFSTKAALVPEDVNGVYDAYEFDGPAGEIHLLSSGRGSEPSMFADASPSGEDVFFATRQALVASDTDGGALDFYDARSGGGFAEPEAAVPSCSGEGCRGALAAPPGAGPAPSSTLRGAGNVRAGRCGKNRRRVTRGGKVRCVRKHRSHQHKQADDNRRAGR